MKILLPGIGSDYGLGKWAKIRHLDSYFSIKDFLPLLCRTRGVNLTCLSEILLNNCFGVSSRRLVSGSLSNVTCQEHSRSPSLSFYFLLTGCTGEWWQPWTHKALILASWAGTFNPQMQRARGEKDSALPTPRHFLLPEPQVNCSALEMHRRTWRVVGNRGADGGENGRIQHRTDTTTWIGKAIATNPGRSNTPSCDAKSESQPQKGPWGNAFLTYRCVSSSAISCRCTATSTMNEIQQNFERHSQSWRSPTLALTLVLPTSFSITYLSHLLILVPSCLKPNIIGYK